MGEDEVEEEEEEELARHVAGVLAFFVSGLFCFSCRSMYEVILQQ